MNRLMIAGAWLCIITGVVYGIHVFDYPILCQPNTCVHSNDGLEDEDPLLYR